MVFDAELKILYIVTIKSGNIELEPYYGTNTTYAFSGDGTNTIKIKPSNANEQSITINNVVQAANATNAKNATSAITSTTADKVAKSLKWGSKTYNGSSEQTITAADLGLSGAMHFLGVTTSNVDEGSTLSSIIIDGKSITQSKGDVVLYSHSEYIWTGSKWEELGSEQSFALKSVEIKAGNGLTGGGTLEATRIISHADTSSQKSITTGGRTYINKIELDDFGHVTSLSTGTESDQTDISGNAATATRLKVDSVGSNELPVYFKDGIPVVIDNFTGTASNSNYLNCLDTRNINDAPYVQKKQLRYELKSASTVGISKGEYIGLLSLCPWSDSSYGYHYQIAFGNDGIQYRNGLNTWSDWYTIANKSDIPTKLSQLTDDLGDSPAHTHKQYALKAGDTITGKYKFTAGLESDAITTESLIVNNSAKFISGITSDSDIIAPTFTGNLKGNADTASSAAIAGKITEHTLWGQKFDGTSNISGAISDITTISSTYLNTTSNKVTIKTVGNAVLNIVGVSSNVDYQHIYVDGNGSSNRPLVLQNGYGNVGIGNSTPTYKLDVTGTARITGDTRLLGNVYASKFIGDLEGTAKSANLAAEASKAINDSSGNNIASTYITNVSTSGQNLVVTKNGNNTTVPINIWESNLQWGGKNFADYYGPIDAAMIPELGANRFAFLRPEGITLEYSKDGGSTWTKETDGYYKRIFSTGTNFYIGQRTGSKSATADWKCRVTIDTKLSRIYTTLNKFAIDCSTNGSQECYGIFEAAKNNSPTIFETIINRFKLSGCNGWNIINGFNITTYANNGSQYQYLRFTFGITTPSAKYNNLNIRKILAFGGVGWTTPSNMAASGHLYSYDSNQNAIFPAAVTATQLKGNLDWSYIQNAPEYKLTAEKISTAWESNKISANGVLSLGTKDVYTLIGITADNVNGIATTGTIQVGTNVNLAANNAETMISSTGVFTQGSMKSKDGFFQTSDIRKKNFLSDIEIDFDALKNLPKKYFEWKDNPDTGKQIGTSAQAILKLYPELVNKDENGYYSIDYARLSIIALAAIDKLNEKIESLKRIINSK